MAKKMLNRVMCAKIDEVRCSGKALSPRCTILECGGVFELSQNSDTIRTKFKICAGLSIGTKDVLNA